MVAGMLDTELGLFGLEVPAICRFEERRRSVESLTVVVQSGGRKERWHYGQCVACECLQRSSTDSAQYADVVVSTFSSELVMSRSKQGRQDDAKAGNKSTEHATEATSSLVTRHHKEEETEARCCGLQVSDDYMHEIALSK